MLLKPGPRVAGLVGFGVGHAFIYRWLAPSWPRGVRARAWRLAALVFFLSFLFWEFFTPFNQCGELLALLGLQLLFWMVIATSEGLVIAAWCEGLSFESRE